MRIGFSIFLLAVGAVLAFAVNYSVAGVNIHVVGWILMAAGVIGLILTMMVLLPRDRRVAAGMADARYAVPVNNDVPPNSPPSTIA